MSKKIVEKIVPAAVRKKLVLNKRLIDFSCGKDVSSAPVGPLGKTFKTYLLDSVKLVVGTAAIILVTFFAMKADAHFQIISCEFCFTENTQLIFLILTILTFERFLLEQPRLRHAAALVLGFFCVCFIRECDGFLDMIYHSCWVVPALAVTVAAVVYAFRDWRRCLRELLEVFVSPGALVVCAVLTLIGLSRLLGMASFWREVMGDGYVRVVKLYVEEGLELFAYGMIFIASRAALKEFRRRDAIRRASGLANEIDFPSVEIKLFPAAETDGARAGTSAAAAFAESALAGAALAGTALTGAVDGNDFSELETDAFPETEFAGPADH